VETPRDGFGEHHLLSEVLPDGLIVTGLWPRFRNHPGDLGTIGAAVRTGFC